MVGGRGGVGGQIGLLAEIDSSATGAAGGLVYHAIAAEIPLDIAPKTPLHESWGESESDSELESESEPESLFSGSGSELPDACWGGAMGLGASLGGDICWSSRLLEASIRFFFPFVTMRVARSFA